MMVLVTVAAAGQVVGVGALDGGAGGLGIAVISSPGKRAAAAAAAARKRVGLSIVLMYA